MMNNERNIAVVLLETTPTTAKFSRMKAIFLLLLSFILCHKTFSQTGIFWKKNIYCFTSQDSIEDRTIKRIIDDVITHESHFKQKFPFPILLDLSIEQEPSYEIGYDNIYGTSLYSDVYQYKTWDYKTLGLRIRIYDSVINEKKLMSMMDYGIRHIKELMERRNKLIKLEAENRPKNTSISQLQIKNIVKSVDNNK